MSFVLLQLSKAGASQCPYQNESYKNTSLWLEFSQTAEFIPTPEQEALQDIIDEIAELNGIFDHFKDRYVS